MLKHILGDALLEDIERAKQKVSYCLTLEGKAERQALGELETLMVKIGSQIENKALDSLDVNGLKELKTNCLYKVVEQIGSLSHLTESQKSIVTEAREFLKSIEANIVYPGYILSEDKFLRRKIKAAKAIMNSLEEDKMNYFIQAKIVDKNPEIEESILVLGKAYLAILGEYRSFGGELIVEDYNNIVKIPKKGSKQKIEANIVNMQSIRDACRLMPTDWILSLNSKALPILINSDITINGENNGTLGRYGPNHLHPKFVRIKRFSPTKKLVFRNIWLKVFVLSLEDNATESTIIHELGHAVVRVNPIVGALEEYHYIKRTTLPSGERNKLKRDGDEYFREGGFVNNYIGKDGEMRHNFVVDYYKETNKSYKRRGVGKKFMFPKEELDEIGSKGTRRSHYELFSSALGFLFTRDLGYLAGILHPKEDEELRHLTLGILAVI